MLDGAPDGRIHRRFAGPSREQAEEQARRYALFVMAYGLGPVAERWDERAGVLSVAYAPRGSASRRRRLVPAGIAAVVAAVAVAAVLALGSALADPHGRPGGRDPAVAPSPSPLPIAETYEGPVPAFIEGECRTFWTDGRRTDCGDLVVLEDRNDPGGRRISLHVAIHRAFDRRPHPEPVVYLDGGPGASPLLDGYWAYPFVHDRDLIVFDQRGTGLSQPSLDCPEVTFLFLRDEIDALRDCRRRLVGEGVSLAAYTSAAIAADLEDLRQALGYETWNLYGISYGTRLALTAMRDHPGGIRSVILDAVYPPQADIYEEGALNAQRAIDKLFSACAADAGCSGRFPQAEERFYELVARLDGRPRKVGDLLGIGGTDVDGSMLIMLLFHRLYITDVLADIPLTLDDFANGQWDELEGWLWDLLAFQRRLGLESLSEGLHYSVQCADELPFSDRGRLSRTDPGVRAEVALALDWRYMIDNCAMWDVPPSDAIENAAVASDISTLLLAGTYDPITPPAWAELAARTLTNAQFFVVPGVGHGALGTSECVDDIVAEFLDEPFLAVDGGCVGERGEPVFRTDWDDLLLGD